VVFYAVIPHGLVGHYQHFGGTFFLHLHSEDDDATFQKAVIFDILKSERRISPSA
jgi:hypothetical protein